MTSPSSNLGELVRACIPAYAELEKERRTGQGVLPIDEAIIEAQTTNRLMDAIEQAGFSKVPDGYERQLRQAVESLDWAVSTGQINYGQAFQPLLKPLDDLSIHILVRYLRPHIPSDHIDRDLYFSSYAGGLSAGQARVLEKNQRFLRTNLVEGGSIQRLATLLFCLGYAQEWKCPDEGIWKDVRREFSEAEFELLRDELSKVNDLRNNHIVHEGELKDAEVARRELPRWIGCICLMADLAT